MVCLWIYPLATLATLTQTLPALARGGNSRGGPSIETGSPRGRFWREQVANLNVGCVVARENYCHVARNGFCAT